MSENLILQGSGLTRIIATILNNAEILQLLAGTGFQVVPPSRPGKAHWPMRTFFSFDPSFGAYTFTGDALMVVSSLGGGNSMFGGNVTESAPEALPLISSGVTDKTSMSLGNKYTLGGDGSISSDFSNNSIIFNLAAPVTSISGGHPLNSLKCTCIYTILDL